MKNCNTIVISPLTPKFAGINPILKIASGIISKNEIYNITPAEKLNMCPNFVHVGFPLHTTNTPPFPNGISKKNKLFLQTTYLILLKAHLEL